MVARGPRPNSRSDESRREGGGSGRGSKMAYDITASGDVLLSIT